MCIHAGVADDIQYEDNNDFCNMQSHCHQSVLRYGALNFGEKETAYCLPIVSAARAAGIRTEIFPDKAKMKKQMSYANAKNIPFVVLAGENEMVQGKVTLKNMETGEQTLVTAEELIAKVNKY